MRYACGQSLEALEPGVFEVGSSERSTSSSVTLQPCLGQKVDSEAKLRAGEGALGAAGSTWNRPPPSPCGVSSRAKAESQAAGFIGLQSDTSTGFRCVVPPAGLLLKSLPFRFSLRASY